MYTPPIYSLHYLSYNPMLNQWQKRVKVAQGKSAQVALAEKINRSKTRVLLEVKKIQRSHK